MYAPVNQMLPNSNVLLLFRVCGRGIIPSREFIRRNRTRNSMRHPIDELHYGLCRCQTERDV